MHSATVTMASQNGSIKDAVTVEEMLADNGIIEGKEKFTSCVPINGKFTSKKPAANTIDTKPIVKIKKA